MEPLKVSQILILQKKKNGMMIQVYFYAFLDGYRIPGTKKEKSGNDLEIIGDDELDDVNVELNLLQDDEDQ